MARWPRFKKALRTIPKHSQPIKTFILQIFGEDKKFLHLTCPLHTAGARIRDYLIELPAPVFTGAFLFGDFTIVSVAGPLYFGSMAMKTKLPETITTVDQAKQFLTELHKNGEAFHCEDDAHDIDFVNCDPTPAEREKLNNLMLDIYWLPGNRAAGPMEFDPCGFLVDLLQNEKEL